MSVDPVEDGLAEHGWTVVHGDSARRTNPDSRIFLNSIGAWVVGPECKSQAEAWTMLNAADGLLTAVEGMASALVAEKGDRWTTQDVADYSQSAFEAARRLREARG